MKRQIFLLAIFMLFTSPCVLAQDIEAVAADSTVIIDEDTALHQESATNELVAGTWHYSGPSVQARGTSLVGKIGKPLAKSKLKKKLDKAFKKLKIKKRWNSLELTPEGKWHMTIAGASINGKYTYDPTNSRITLKWHGIPLRSQVMREGKHLHLLFDTDQLLTILRWVSGLSNNDTLKAIAFLSSNYTDVKVGFDLKQ